MEVYVTGHDWPYFEEILRTWHGPKFCISDRGPTPDKPVVFMRSPCIGGCTAASHIAVHNDSVVWNTEQLTRPGLLDALAHSLRVHGIRRVFDYSAFHAALWASRGFECTLRPVWSHAEVAELKRLMAHASRPQSFTWAFVGTMSPRRAAVISALRSRGEHVRVIEGFGPQRDQCIAECHGLLNVHYAPEYKVFECVRCMRWALAGMRVVSETCIDQGPPFECVEFQPYEYLLHGLTGPRLLAAS